MQKPEIVTMKSMESVLKSAMALVAALRVAVSRSDSALLIAQSMLAARLVDYLLGTISFAHSN